MLCATYLGLPDPNTRDRSSSRRSLSRSVSRSPSPAAPRESLDDEDDMVTESVGDGDRPRPAIHSNGGGGVGGDVVHSESASGSVLLSELQWLADELAVHVVRSADAAKYRSELITGVLRVTGTTDVSKLLASMKARAKDLPAQRLPTSTTTSRDHSRSRSRSSSSHHRRRRRRHSRSPSSSRRSVSSSFNSGSSSDSSSSSSSSAAAAASSSSSARARSDSRSRSPRSCKHHRRRSRSRSRSHSRSRRHRRSSSSSSSSSRSRSRSHHRSRSPSRSHSRDRSPPPAPLSVPDHLAPTYKPVAGSEVKKLLKGKYVHIDSLIRQPQSSKNPNESKHISNLGNGVSLHTSSSKSSRVVKEPLDWFEAMLSSMLPVQVRLASQASTLDEAKTALVSVERYICYSLAAITYFRKYTFDDAKKYLESHRRSCIETGTNLSEPDILQLTQLTPYVASPQSMLQNTRPHGMIVGNQSNNSNNHGRGQRSKHGKPYNKQDCGKFNSRDGCSYENCIFDHVCRHCGSKEHGKSSCPKFVAEQKAVFKPRK